MRTVCSFQPRRLSDAVRWLFLISVVSAIAVLPAIAQIDRAVLEGTVLDWVLSDNPLLRQRALTAFASMNVPISVDAVCSRGGASTTSTVWLTLPTCSLKSTLATWFSTRAKELR